MTSSQYVTSCRGGGHVARRKTGDWLARRRQETVCPLPTTGCRRGSWWEWDRSSEESQERRHCRSPVKSWSKECLEELWQRQRRRRRRRRSTSSTSQHRLSLLRTHHHTSEDTGAAWPRAASCTRHTAVCSLSVNQFVFIVA